MENRPNDVNQPLNQHNYQPVPAQTQPYEPVHPTEQYGYEPVNQYGEYNRSAQPNAYQPMYQNPPQQVPQYPTQPVQTNKVEVIIVNQQANDEQVLGKAYDNDYDDGFMHEVRRGFVIKVYGILSVTLLFTALFCVGPTVNSSVANYLINNIWILITFAILSFVPLWCLFWFINLARTVPINYILLFAFVFCESVIVAYACASVGNPKIVMIAAMMTMGMTLILTAFAWTTKIDFTICFGLLFVLLGSLLLFGIMCIIVRSDILYLFYCTLGIFVYGVYLLIDTQLICGGHTWQLSEEDYIVGALILYMDIIVLFLKILSLLASKR